MIISASYKTDIPAFYGEWFLNRLTAGYCKIANPFNRAQRHTISLRREEIDGFIFWTKNLAPFMGALQEVRDRGFPFVVQYTINGYPRMLESRVVDASSSIQHFRSAAEKYGDRVAVWRYDTIIFTTKTDANFHRRNFEHIAGKLAGATDEVVVSFMQLYDKTRRNMDEAARSFGFEWEDPPATIKSALLKDLTAIAADHKMRLSICTQPELLVDGAGEARCVDASRLSDVAGRAFRATLKGMRKGCGCFESKDIGDYDTCPHGCVYCYAVRSRSLALKRYKAHDPLGDYLFPQEPEPPETTRKSRLPLFPDED
jgi:uncharacterized protein DUF1848